MLTYLKMPETKIVRKWKRQIFPLDQVDCVLRGALQPIPVLETNEREEVILLSHVENAAECVGPFVRLYFFSLKGECKEMAFAFELARVSETSKLIFRDPCIFEPLRKLVHEGPCKQPIVAVEVDNDPDF